MAKFHMIRCFNSGKDSGIANNTELFRKRINTLICHITQEKVKCKGALGRRMLARVARCHEEIRMGIRGMQLNCKIRN